MRIADALLLAYFAGAGVGIVIASFADLGVPVKMAICVLGGAVPWILAKVTGAPR